MAGLLTVPLEILLQITSYLTTPEYGYLRRTCKQLEALLFGAFAREFFSKRQFALMEFSIQGLVDIAKSRLGPSLTHLIIHLECPRSPPPMLGAITTQQEAIKHNRYRAERINHLEFITSGLDVEMLSDAIKHLPNLDTIGVRDFDSPNRSRDNTAWHSYGCPTFLNETNASLGLPSSAPSHSGILEVQYTGHVFLTLLRAIGNAEVSGQTSTVTRLEVLFHRSKLPDHAFKIPDRFQAVVSSALSKLETIFLDGLSGSSLDFLISSTHGVNNITSYPGYFLSRFLANLSALQHLRLNFQDYHYFSTERLLLWLANASPVDSRSPAHNSDDLPIQFPPAPTFPNLQYLDIGMAAVNERVLLALYKNYKSTLRGVSLHKTELRCKRGTRKILWVRLFNEMAAADLQLQTLSLSYLTQAPAGSQDRCLAVTFKDSENIYVKTWRGNTFSQSIKDVTSQMEATKGSRSFHARDWPGEVDSDSTDDGSYEDSDAEDE